MLEMKVPLLLNLWAVFAMSESPNFQNLQPTTIFRQNVEEKREDLMTFFWERRQSDQSVGTPECFSAESTDSKPKFPFPESESCANKPAVTEVGYSLVFDNHPDEYMPFWTILLDITLDEFAVQQINGLRVSYSSTDELHELYGDTYILFNELPLDQSAVTALKGVALKSPYRKSDTFKLTICPVPYCRDHLRNCLNVTISIPDQKHLDVSNLPIKQLKHICESGNIHSTPLGSYLFQKREEPENAPVVNKNSNSEEQIAMTLFPSSDKEKVMAILVNSDGSLTSRYECPYSFYRNISHVKDKIFDHNEELFKECFALTNESLVMDVHLILLVVVSILAAVLFLTLTLVFVCLICKKPAKEAGLDITKIPSSKSEWKCINDKEGEEFLYGRKWWKKAIDYVKKIDVDKTEKPFFDVLLKPENGNLDDYQIPVDKENEEADGLDDGSAKPNCPVEALNNSFAGIDPLNNSALNNSVNINNISNGPVNSSGNWSPLDMTSLSNQGPGDSNSDSKDAINSSANESSINISNVNNSSSREASSMSAMNTSASESSVDLSNICKISHLRMSVDLLVNNSSSREASSMSAMNTSASESSVDLSNISNTSMSMPKTEPMNSSASTVVTIDNAAKMKFNKEVPNLESVLEIEEEANEVAVTDQLLTNRHSIGSQHQAEEQNTSKSSGEESFYSKNESHHALIRVQGPSEQTTTNQRCSIS